MSFGLDGFLSNLLKSSSESKRTSWSLKENNSRTSFLNRSLRIGNFNGKEDCTCSWFPICLLPLNQNIEMEGKRNSLLLSKPIKLGITKQPEAEKEISSSHTFSPNQSFWILKFCNISINWPDVKRRFLLQAILLPPAIKESPKTK